MYIYIYALLETMIPEKKYNVSPFQNGCQITDFYPPFRFWPKFEKPLSERNFFNEIWLKVGENE